MTDVLTHDQLEEVLLEARQGLIAIFGDKLEKLWLYGSYARGEATPESDIDVMATSARILDKYRDAYIALGGAKDVLTAREERANGYVGRHAEDVLADIDKILDGFTDDFFENGREQAVLNQEELNRGDFDI